MSEHIWIVWGETGGCSETAVRWSVAAFTTFAEADALCEQLNAWCRDNGMQDRVEWQGTQEKTAAAIRELDERQQSRAHLSPDPSFTCDGATTYTVTACALGAMHRDCAECRAEHT